nr:RNA-directed DNA polymerase, eukaryota [Tanacetum cinerariifolium]
MQTQTSNTLHNAIMEAGSKDRPPMLAPEIRDQLNDEAKAVQIILTGIDNDIYSTVDACPNACEMWKAIERSQQAATQNRGKAIVNSPQPIYDQEPFMVAEDDEMSKNKEIDKLMALISLSFKKIYKPTNNNLRTSSNTSRANQDNSPRINRSAGYENQRIGNVVEARENKPKRAKDTAYHREKILLCKQEEAGIQLNAEQAFLNNLQLEWKQYATMIRQNKNLMDINIDAVYSILNQNQGDVNDAMGLKKKNVVVTSDPLALITEKTKVSKKREKLVVSSDSKGSDADDFSELKKI